MNSKPIINDNMTLEEKLAAIDIALKTSMDDYNKANGRTSNVAPLDPADALMCEGCQ